MQHTKHFTKNSQLKLKPIDTKVESVTPKIRRVLVLVKVYLAKGTSCKLVTIRNYALVAHYYK